MVLRARGVGGVQVIDGRIRFKGAWDPSCVLTSLVWVREFSRNLRGIPPASCGWSTESCWRPPGPDTPRASPWLVVARPSRPLFRRISPPITHALAPPLSRHSIHATICPSAQLVDVLPIHAQVHLVQYTYIPTYRASHVYIPHTPLHLDRLSICA